MTTKEKILMEALTLFSEKGFEPVSVRDIARAVGIKESSLYNHFKNKQDIFDELLRLYSSRGSEFFRQMELTGDDMQFEADQNTVDFYSAMTAEQFTALGARIFDYYFTDEINVKFRKMLTIEQYRSTEIGKMFRDISFDASIDYQSQLFAAFMEAGLFAKADPYVLALEFFAPIFLIFYKYDNNAESLAQAKELFLRHLKHFNKTYGTKSVNK